MVRCRNPDIVHPLLGTFPLGQKHRGKWCSNNDLQLNVAKTKKTIIDFRKNKTAVTTLAIRKQHEEFVDSFRFLG